VTSGGQLPSAADPRPLKRRSWLHWLFFILLLIAGAILLRYFQHRTAARAAAQRAIHAPPIAAVAARAHLGSIGIYINGLGTVVPVRTVTVSSRVDGQLMQVLYKEGQLVHQDDRRAEDLAHGDEAERGRVIERARREVHVVRAEGRLPEEAEDRGQEQVPRRARSCRRRPSRRSRRSRPNTLAQSALQSSPSATAVASATGGAGATARPIGGEGAAVVRNIQVVADKDQNTILLIATPSEYSIIEQALRKLDVPSRQVMIEVTIAEVKLTDQLQFGVDWVFKGGAPSGRGSGGNFNQPQNAAFNPAVPLPTSAPGALAAGLTVAAQGFSYLINNANFPGGVQAVLHLLDKYGNTKVIANPHIAALDNQKATIKAGNRIPVNQQTIVGNTTNAVTTTSQYIDTGVLLQVTPHINDGGLVTLDVQAEVSSPGTPDVVGAAPPIDTRSVQTLLAVPSGETMVMGGLIQETKGNTTNGLPWLARIPGLGALFGNQTLDNNRSELVLFITPRAVDDVGAVSRVIEELRRKMERLDDVFPPKPNKVS
jgi:type II secretion system protein D